MPSDDDIPGGPRQESIDEASGSPRRPATRSRARESTKRRRQERSVSPGDTGRDSSSGSETRSRTHKQHKSYDGAVLSPTCSSSNSSTATSVSSECEAPTLLSATSGDSESNSALQTTQITFLDGSLTTTATLRSERPGPKSRANLPIPVPNLTKKSRGRRVPTKLAQTGEERGVAAPGVKEGRMYVCQVEGCGKCFHRGEHLKRHIRSIHTHEKPFKCSHPMCNKNFNRHDNLLQHLKVHKGREVSPDPSDPEDEGSQTPYRPREGSPVSPSSSPRIIPPPPRARVIPTKDTRSRAHDTSPYPLSEPESEEDMDMDRRSPSPVASPPSAPTAFRTITSSFNSKSGAARYPPSYGTASGAFTTSATRNDASRMAVSSLRTEMDSQDSESPLRQLCELAVSSSGQEA